MVDALDKNILEVIGAREAPNLDGVKPDERIQPPLTVSELKSRLRYNVTEEAVQKRISSLEDGGYIRYDEGAWRLTFKGKMALAELWDTLSKMQIVEEMPKMSPEVVAVPPTEERQAEARPPFTSQELAADLENLSSKRQQAIEFLRELKRSYDAGLVSSDLYESFRQQFSSKLDEMERDIESKISFDREARVREVETIRSEFEGQTQGVGAVAEKRTFGSIIRSIDELVLGAMTGIAFLIAGILLVGKIYNPTSILFFGLDAWILVGSIGITLALITGILIASEGKEIEETSE